MSRLTHSLAAALAVLATAPAQQNESEAIGRGVEIQLLPEVTSRLGSDNLATIAWGAHIAARHRLAPAVPALLTTLERLRKQSGLDASELRFATLALLDALVQAKAKVPLDALQSYQQGLTLPVLFVLLARDAVQSRKFFVDHYRRYDAEGRSSYWLACGNLLAANKDDALAGMILPTLKYTLAVTVRDPGSHAAAGIGGSSGTGFGDGKLNVPEGFPPTVLYKLTTKGQVGDMLIAPGVMPVFARRTEYRRRRFGIGSNEPNLGNKRQGVRRQWLAELLDTYPSSIGNFDPSMTVEWQDNAHYVDSVTKRQAKLRESFAELVARCVEERRLAADATDGLTAKITCKVFDLRKRPEAALPKLQ